MREWPRIDEPLLLERLALDDAAFLTWVEGLAAALGRRPCPPELVERALGYPWARPARSYLLEDDTVVLLDALDPEARAGLVGALTDAASGRRPLLAFGSNGAPATLTAKFAHLGEEDRRVLVTAGELHDFDVGASAQPTAYGSLPATLFASPGTAVRAAVLWVTDTQFTQLTWTEISYRLGRLDGVRFACDQPGVDVDGLLAFVSRFGVFCPDGHPAALAAIPAEGRTATPLTQEGLLDRAAEIAIGPDAVAADLVQAIFADVSSYLARTGDAIRRRSQPFASPRWTEYPGARTPP